MEDAPHLVINLRLRVTSMPNIDAWAEAIQLGAEDAAPAVAEVLVEDALTCFAEERTPWGDAWPDLKRATWAERERLGKMGKMLNRDGVLRGSVFGTPVGRQSGVVTAEVGAGGPAAAYAMAQQATRSYLPVRPSGEVDLPAALDAEVQATIRDAIDLRMDYAMRQDIAAEE